jgi:hypothetical protein
MPGWTRTARECRPGKRHRYDPVSGWCVHGCGNRNDGRVVSRGGDVLIRAVPVDDGQIDGVDDA